MAVIRQIISGVGGQGPGTLGPVARLQRGAAARIALWIAAIVLTGIVLFMVLGAKQPLPMEGDWIGERNASIHDNSLTPMDVTENRVKLTVTQDGKFTLVDKSAPFEGKLDLTATSQTLDIQSALGQPIARFNAGAAPQYKLTWMGNDAMKVQGPGTDVVLHRSTKPASS